MKLKVKWDAFYSQISDYIKEAEGILIVREELCTIKSYEFILATTNNWINKCYTFLRKAFDQPDNVYAERFYSEKPYSFYLDDSELKTRDHLKEVFQNLSIKKNWLLYNLRLLSVCDVIVRPETIDEKVRENFGIEQTVDLLFEKLYELNDGSYYPVHAILRGNGIKLKENRAFSTLLIKYEAEGNIKLISNSSICGQLTLKGKSLLEQSGKHQIKQHSRDAHRSLTKVAIKTN